MSRRYPHRGDCPVLPPLRVRFRECDPQGIVFNGNYVGYFDDAITELWRRAFGSYRAMVERGIDMVVGEINLTFIGSARFDELVEVEATIEKLGTTSMTTELELLRDGESLVQCRIRHVFVDTGSKDNYLTFVDREVERGEPDKGRVEAPMREADNLYDLFVFLGENPVANFWNHDELEPFCIYDGPRNDNLPNHPTP